MICGARLALFGFAVFAAACDGQFRFDDAADAGISATTDARAPGDAAVDGSGPFSSCANDSDCKLASLHCDSISHSCVACVDDSNCAAPHPRCDAALHRCVECGVDGDCGSGQKCDPTSRHCFTTCSSLITDDCPGDEPVCNTMKGMCYRCTASIECTFSDTDTLCDVGDGKCVGCLNDTQCSGTTPRCDPVGEECVQCVGSSDCTSPTPVCDPTKLTCVSD